MKKLLLVFGIVATMFLLACTKKTNKNVNNSTNGNIMSLEFTTNPSTGFEWQYQFLNGGILLEVVSDEYNNVNNEDGIVGASCQRIIKFKAIKAGNTTLKFVYRRPWSGGDTAYDVIYEIKVSDDLKISCAEKKNGGYAPDVDLSIFPNPVFEN